MGDWHNLTGTDDRRRKLKAMKGCVPTLALVSSLLLGFFVLSLTS